MHLLPLIDCDFPLAAWYFDGFENMLWVAKQERQRENEP